MQDNLVYAVFLVLPVVAGTLVYLFFCRYHQHVKTTWRWTRLALGNLLVLAMLVSLCLLAGETYYRFWHDTTDSFGLTKTHQRWMERHFNSSLNNRGCRDDVDYTTLIPAGKRRVAFLGDSFAAGHGIKNLRDRFANCIRHLHPEWDIQVIAGLGNSTLDELGMVWTLLLNQQVTKQDLPTYSQDPSGRIILVKDVHGRSILGRDRHGRVVMRDNLGNLCAESDALHAQSDSYQFDYFLLVYCLNDIVDEIPEWPNVLKRIYDESTPHWLGQHSYLFNTVHFRIFAARDPDLRSFCQSTLAAYDTSGKIWPAHRDRLVRLRDLIVTGGGELLVVTFPYMDQLGPNYQFQAIHGQLDRVWKDIGVPHLDLLPVFERNLSRSLVVNRFDAHPNELAHQLAADAINDFLIKHVTGQGRTGESR